MVVGAPSAGVAPAEVPRHIVDATPDPQPVLELDLDDVVRLQTLEVDSAVHAGARGLHEDRGLEARRARRADRDPAPARAPARIR